MRLQDVFFHKESYEPSESRFEISDDPISQDRYIKLVTAYRDLTQYIPDVHFGFSLFGSLTKGKRLRSRNLLKLDLGNKNISDIDLVCYYDSADLAKHHETLFKNNREYREEYGAIMRRKHPKADIALFEPSAGDETMVIIMRRRVQAPFAMMHDSPVINANMGSISLDGKDSILLTIDNYFFDAKHPPRVTALARFFHFDVGGGLTRYRRDFLDK